MKKDKNTQLTDEELYNSLGINLTKYVTDVFDFIRHGSGNCVVNAVSGAGKTTLIVNCMKILNNTEKCLFIAFNRDIVNELKKRVGSYPNVHVRTSHSLGFYMLKTNLPENKLDVDEFKYKKYLRKNISYLSMDPKVSEKRFRSSYIDTTSDLLNIARVNLCQTVQEIETTAKKYSIVLRSDESNAVLQLMKWGKENLDTVDFADMIWIPNELSLKPIGLKYDWVFVDECQDLNRAQRELFLKCMKGSGRFIAVGDINQAIYGFAGADFDSFQALCDLPNTIRLPLSMTYRCAKKIVELAKSINSEIEPLKDAPEGQIMREVKLKKIKSGDMVLCRIKKPLMDMYMRFLEAKIPAYINGSEIGANLVHLIESTEKDDLNVGLDKDGVFGQLYLHLVNTRNSLMVRFGYTIKEASISPVVVELIESIQSLEILSKGLKTASGLISRIERVFKNNGDGIILSTVHKAKGLEADRVFIACPSLIPHKLAETPWQLKQEDNIRYVAYTRPKTVLGFISEKEVSDSGAISTVGDVVEFFKTAEKVVNRLYSNDIKNKIVDVSKELEKRKERIKEVSSPNKKSLSKTSDNENKEESDIMDEIAASFNKKPRRKSIAIK